MGVIVATTVIREYQLESSTAKEFARFLVNEVAPAREKFGFIVHSIWLSSDTRKLYWLVSHEGSSVDYDRLERKWEKSDIRRVLFDGLPKYVLDSSTTVVHKVTSY